VYIYSKYGVIVKSNSCSEVTPKSVKLTILKMVNNLTKSIGKLLPNETVVNLTPKVVVLYRHRIVLKLTPDFFQCNKYGLKTYLC